MVQISLAKSLSQCLFISGLLGTAWLATVFLIPAAGIKLVLVLFLTVQSISMFTSRIWNLLPLFSSPANYTQLALGSQFCRLECDGFWRRFQHPKVLYCSEFLIVLAFSSMPDEASSGRSGMLRRCSERHCIVLTPDSLTSEDDWYLRRYLHALYCN